MAHTHPAQFSGCLTEAQCTLHPFRDVAFQEWLQKKKKKEAEVSSFGLDLPASASCLDVQFSCAGPAPASNDTCIQPPIILLQSTDLPTSPFGNHCLKGNGCLEHIRAKLYGVCDFTVLLVKTESMQL